MFLPDGVHFLYVKVTDVRESSGVFVGTLDDPAGHRLLADGSSVEFVPNSPGSSAGHLLFLREGNLVAQSFDAGSLQLAGEPFIVAEQVDFTSTPGQIAASASAIGSVALLVNGYPERELRWYDRSGKEGGRVAATGSSGTGVSLAPNGRSVGFLRNASTGSRLLDLDRNQESRLLADGFPVVWSPDSRRIAFRGGNDGTSGLYIRDAGGGLPELLVRGGDNPLNPSGWSSDGRYITYTEVDPKTFGNVWLVPLSTPRTPAPLLQTAANESQASISPDGGWLAYYSTESSPAGVFARRLSNDLRLSNAALTVSDAYAMQPRWRADGKELFYLERIAGSRRLKLTAVAFNATSDNPLGVPQSLFEFTVLPQIVESNLFLYSPSADGQRFLVNAYPPDSESSLELLINWPASLAR
jgi:dipeptidyl aminopeptidase/acylaminoacyl peptidase